MAVTVFYANKNMEDIGVLKGFKLDMSISMESGNNDYEVRTSIGGVELDEGYYIYAEDSEYGGIVDTKRINTKTNTLYYGGRTWRGLLESKIIVPPSGQDYYKASGDLNTVINTLINDFGLTELFYVDDTPTGETVTNYQFNRYVDVYSGIIRLLSNRDYKLVIQFDNNALKCKLSAVPIVDYGEYQEITSDLYDFDISKVRGTVNHLIGLGSGELKNRLVLHKYANASGVISDTQTLFGKNEVAAIYENPNAEDSADLEELMTEQFQKMIGSDSIKITLNDVNADVGDKITAYEEHTGIEAIQYIQSKVITIDDDTINVQHTAKTISVGSVGSGGESSINQLNTVYPVGSVICMNTNTNPANKLGGVWELIDKEFSPLSSSTNVFNRNTTNVTSVTTTTRIAGHSIHVRIAVVLAVAMGETNVQLGSLNLAGLGINDMPYEYVYGFQDDANGIGLGYINATGLLTNQDVIVKSGTSIESGSSMYYEVKFLSRPEHMIDSACDKFYFRRTS